MYLSIIVTNLEVRNVRVILAVVVKIIRTINTSMWVFKYL